MKNVLNPVFLVFVSGDATIRGGFLSIVQKSVFHCQFSFFFCFLSLFARILQLKVNTL